MLLASTSSAYGVNIQMPYSENDKADHQISFYAATKKATENFSHSYSHLFNLPITVFRFFTVYGPWGRPDMALFKFTEAILKDKKIDVFNHGKMTRDFTYIDDLVHAIRLLVEAVPVVGSPKISSDSISPVAPFRIVNIGNSSGVNLLDYIKEIEKALGKKARKNMMPMQDGDVPSTLANTELLQSLTGFCPNTHHSEGVARFVEWYKNYYG